MILLVVLSIFLFVTAVMYSYLYTRKVDTEIRHRFEEWSEEEAIRSLANVRGHWKALLLLLRPIANLNDLLPLGNFKRRVNRKLITANVPLTVNEFMAIKEISLLLVPVLYYLLIGSLPSPDLAILLGFIGFVLPDMWLNNRIAKRRKEISRELPNVIDLLKLCVEAGMDFMLAVKRVVRDYKPCAVTEELSHVWRQIQMGRSRAEALRHMAWRVDMPEVSSFVRALIQGDKMGTPIGEILRIQANEMRLYRIMKAEEAAMTAPIKMLFPLLFFILPVILIVVAGPVILKFMKGDMFGGFR